MKAPSAMIRLLVIALCLLGASLTWGQPRAPSTRTFATQAAFMYEAEIEAHRELSAAPGTRATELSADASVPRR